MTTHIDSDLADFIQAQMPEILEAWERYAKTLLPAGARLDSHGLRDHAEHILQAIQRDLRTSQSRAQSIAKSQGQAPRADPAHTAAETHALLRAADGFTLEQLVAEYRALRSSVLRLWADSRPTGPDVIADIGRFNEAIDQALAESVVFFNREVERWRNVFLGVLGHELRGPLEAVLLTSQLISKLAGNSPVSAPTQRLLRTGERMATLLDDLLEYNRSTLGLGIPVRPAACDLAAAVGEEVELRRASLPGVTIEWTAGGACLGVWDASRMKQVVGNLVSNAARHGTAHAPISVRLLADEHRACLVVENIGPAIPPELQQVIFEPLRRGGLSDAHAIHGMGLGLFIAREIVRGHGGTITVASGHGKTTFTVVVPR